MAISVFEILVFYPWIKIIIFLQIDPKSKILNILKNRKICNSATSHLPMYKMSSGMLFYQIIPNYDVIFSKAIFVTSGNPTKKWQG